MQNGDVGIVGVVIYLAILVFMIAALWRVFQKAGQPGWAAIIPIVNVYFMLLVAKKPGWWLILYFIPIVNIIIAILVNLAIAENFKKGVGFGIGLILLPIIFYPILGFGSATYKK